MYCSSKMQIPGMEDLGEGIEARLVKLREKKTEMEALLKAIETTLIEDGYLDDSKAASRQNFSIMTGIRINEKLSFRGKEKAREFFDYLDEDGDGYLTLKDIRGM